MIKALSIEKSSFILKKMLIYLSVYLLISDMLLKYHRYFFLIKKMKYTALQKLRYNLLLLFYSFVHNSSINEFKNMKLSEHIFYEMIN